MPRNQQQITRHIKKPMFLNTAKQNDQIKKSEKIQNWEQLIKDCQTNLLNSFNKMVKEIKDIKTPGETKEEFERLHRKNSKSHGSERYSTGN